MTERCIGIDIGSSHLCAVQVVRVGEKFCIEKVFGTPIRRSTDFLPDMLRSILSKHGFDRRAQIAVSMPHNAVFFSNVQTGLPDLEDIRRDELTILRHGFPIEPDEILIQVHSCHRFPNGKHSVFAAATSVTSLQDRLSILSEAKMHPDLVDVGIFAVHSAVMVNHPEIATAATVIVHVDESCLTLAVTRNSAILAVRNIPIVPHPDRSLDSIEQQVAQLLSREVQITWQKVFGDSVESDCKIYLAIGDNSYHDLKPLIEQSIDCQVIVVDTCAKLQPPPDYSADGTICIAEGLALRLLVHDKVAGTDFLKAYHTSAKPALDTKKEISVCAMLLTAVVIIWLIGLFTQLSHLETSCAHAKDEIRDVFQSTLPDEKNIVSPLVQLEQKLESFRGNYQLFASFHPERLSALEILYSITRSTPAHVKVRVDDLLIAGDRVRISGTCDSFEVVYEWQRLLGQVSGFGIADVRDVQREPKSGLVHFVILLSSAVEESP